MEKKPLWLFFLPPAAQSPVMGLVVLLQPLAGGLNLPRVTHMNRVGTEVGSCLWLLSNSP